LEKGGYAVLSNKKPLTLSIDQFDKLQKSGSQRLFTETVVGAGLPILRMIKDMQDSGDEVVEIQGCFSGTLGFIFSQLDTGRKFSEVVLEAKEKGFSEPDVRDDLSGMDVARKALILARTIGQKRDLEEIQLTGLYPKEMGTLTAETFLQNLHTLDIFYAEKIAKARKNNAVLRFVAHIDAKGCQVGLKEVLSSSEIGSLQGVDNICVIKTKRYFHNPLVIKGPGAGREVTAGGVFADLLEIIRKESI
jgi:homoserine dehydrogenase